MSIHLDPFDRRDIKFSAKHIYLGLVLGALVVAVQYWLEPKSPAYELCKEVAQTAYEECRNDASSQNDGPIKKSATDCGRERQQDLLACY
jgi:hypothetical protein